MDLREMAEGAGVGLGTAVDLVTPGSEEFHLGMAVRARVAAFRCHFMGAGKVGEAGAGAQEGHGELVAGLAHGLGQMRGLPLLFLGTGD